MKNIYEVLDEFERAKNKKDRMGVIGQNLSRILTEVLQLTFHPQYDWYIKELPEWYKPNDVPPGMGYAQLSTEVGCLFSLAGCANARSQTVNSKSVDIQEGNTVHKGQ